MDILAIFRVPLSTGRLFAAGICVRKKFHVLLEPHVMFHFIIVTKDFMKSYPMEGGSDYDAQGSQDRSIQSRAQRDERLRSFNRDFLIDTFNAVSASHRNSNLDGLSRYYQLRINSLYNSDYDSLKQFQKSARLNTRCIRCGNRLTLKIQRRKRQNKSKLRKYCRYLRGYSIEFCDKCFGSCKNKLFGRRQAESRLRSANTKRSRKNIPTSKKKPSIPQVSASEVMKTKATTTGAREKKIPIPPKSNTKTAQFSSRLRAFSCLLKD